MMWWKKYFIPAAAMALIGSGAAFSQVHQHMHGQAPAQGQQPPAVSNMPANRAAMMQDPHAVLAMAYRRDLATFARALHDQVQRTDRVDPTFARTAIDEMQRSLADMQMQHDEHVKALSPEMRTQMEPMIQQMKSGNDRIKAELDALNKTVTRGNADPKTVAAQSQAILDELNPMSGMAAGQMRGMHNMGGMQGAMPCPCMNGGTNQKKQ